MGLGMTVQRTVTSKLFLEDPHKAAHKVWEESGYDSVIVSLHYQVIPRKVVM